MFWKKKAHIPETSVSLLHSYAAKLGIERRLSPRVLYPNPCLTSLPGVFFGSAPMKVHNISVGGVCLIDKEDVMGPSAGNDLDLRLIWPEGEITIRSRIVSRVDVRRHIQFLDISPEMVLVIKNSIYAGVLGQSMQPINDLRDTHLAIYASEAWTSLHGECLTFLEDIHISAELYLDGKNFRFPKEAWPITKDNLPITPLEMEQVLIFLENIPRPTSAVSILKGRLQTFCFEGRP